MLAAPCLILGLLISAQAPPAGVEIDSAQGEIRFPAKVNHPVGKPCIDAWGQRIQAFIGCQQAGGKPTQFADHFVFLAGVDVDDVYQGLTEAGANVKSHVSRAEGRKVAGKQFLDGDEVAIFVSWQENGRKVERPYESFVQERVTINGKDVVRPWTPHWVFHGSGAIHKEGTGCVACPCDCPGGLIADNRNPIYEPKPTVRFDLSNAPPEGTPVVIRIRRVANPRP